MFNGNWVPDFKGSMYTNSSCATISTSKNCFRHGRKDRDFLNWRWKPEKCDLPRFDAKAYLDIVRGKTLAFIGDSVARNHIESLLCLLSQVSCLGFLSFNSPLMARLEVLSFFLWNCDKYYERQLLLSRPRMVSTLISFCFGFGVRFPFCI